MRKFYKDLTMASLRLLADNYFDGVAELRAQTMVSDLDRRRDPSAPLRKGFADAGCDARAAFVVPGLVEAHAHLFLDGGELRFRQAQRLPRRAEKDDAAGGARKRRAACGGRHASPATPATAMASTMRSRAEQAESCACSRRPSASAAEALRQLHGGDIGARGRRRAIVAGMATADTSRSS